MQGAEVCPVDRDVTCPLLRSTHGQDRRKLHRVLTGSLQSRERCYRHGQAASPTCPWCSQAPETVHHIVHECAAWEEHRCPDLCSLQSHPPQPPLAPQSHPAQPPCTVLCGLALESQSAREAQVIRAAVGDAPIPQDITVGLTNATWAAQEGLSEEGRVIIFTDGACKNNEHALLRQARRGAFWGLDHPANFSLPLVGVRQTNQRAELNAVLRTMQLDARPLEIRTDSRYVVDGINRHGYWAGRGWVGDNADLWNRVSSLLRARPGRVKVVWVKGHATLSHVAMGVTTWYNRIGNSCADRLVSQACSHGLCE